MKILCQYNPKSGGSYHRVKLWSSFLDNVTYTEKIEESQVRECDLVYIHWTCLGVSIPQLSVWKSKYGFKVVADIDDVWDNWYPEVVFSSQHLCLFADLVICSTDYVAERVREYTQSSVEVVENLLPFGELQFTPKTTIHKKWRIGIGGSTSHLPDYFSLHSTINKLESERWFRDNCEFVIIGYDGKDPLWKRFAGLFRDVRLFKYRDVDNYMSLYDELDVILLPLLDTPINRGRSNLKVYECLSKGVIPIIGELYLDKDEINYQLRVEDWCQHIYSIVNGSIPNVPKVDIDYYRDCVQERLHFFQGIEVEPGKHNLYSITYADGQKGEYQTYRNYISTKEMDSHLFEYNPMIDIIDNLKKDGYVGIFSHKFPFKTGYYKKYVEQILDQEESDVVIFCQQIPNYLRWTEEQHRGFMDVFTRVCDRLDLVVIEPKISDTLGLIIREPKVTVYSNFFAAKSEIYKEYVELIKQAIQIMNEPDLKDLVWQDPKYLSGLLPDELKKYTGLDHYTYHTFILERLMSVWIDNKNLTYTVYD